MAKKKHQIVFNYPPPFPHDGDAEINGNLEANDAELKNVKATSLAADSVCGETVIATSRMTTKSISICDDTGFADGHSKLHVDGCISLSPVSEIPAGRTFKNGYLFDMGGNLHYKRLDDAVVVLSDCITILESNGKGTSLSTDDGRKLKTITAKDGINVSEGPDNIQISLANQIDSAANLGSIGEGIFSAVNGRTALYKKISGGENIELSSTGKTITISYSGRGFIRLVSSELVRNKQQFSNILWSTQGGYSNAHVDIKPNSKNPYAGINLQITNLREGQEYTLYVTNKSRKVYRPFADMVVYYGYGNVVTNKQAPKIVGVEDLKLGPNEVGIVKMISTIEDDSLWSFYIDRVSKLK